MNKAAITGILICALASGSSLFGDFFAPAKQPIEKALNRSNELLQAGEGLVRKTGILAELGAKDHADNLIKLEALEDKTRKAMATASTYKEKLALKMTFLDMKESHIKNIIGTLDRAAPGIRDTAQSMQSVLGQYGEQSAWFKEAAKAPVALEKAKETGKKAQQDLKFLKAELDGLDPKSSEYFKTEEKMNEKVIELVSVYEDAKVQKIESVYYDSLHKQFSKQEDILVKVRIWASRTAARFDIDKKRLQSQLKMIRTEKSFARIGESLGNTRALALQAGKTASTVNGLIGAGAGMETIGLPDVEGFVLPPVDGFGVDDLLKIDFDAL